MTPEITRFNIQPLYTTGGKTGGEITTYQILLTVDKSHGSQFDLGNANAFYLREPAIENLTPWESLAHLIGFCSNEVNSDNYKGLFCSGMNDPEKVKEVKKYRKENQSDQVDFELINMVYSK